MYIIIDSLETKQYQNVNVSNKEDQKIDITHFPKGIYIVKITGNNFSASKTITKE